MSGKSEDQLLELALAISDHRETKPPEGAGLDEDEREAAAVLFALGRLFGVESSAAEHEGHDVSEPPVATSWGSFELRERIGGGSFGEIYRARDGRLERDVAVKLYRAPRGLTKESEVWREGRLMARVRHPNVASVFGVEEYDGIVGIVMELVEGEDFASSVANRGPMSAREAALIGVDLCRALAALHHAQVLHRDVKAENVLREAGGRTVLVDLGIGLEVGEASLPMGTPLYLAPELFETGEPSPQSDIYSLGVMLFFLVSGRLPVEAEQIAELREAHRNGRRQTLRDARPDVPWSFAQLVEACLDRDPGARPRSAGELERLLVEILYPRRWRPEVLLAASVAIALSSALVWLVGGRSSEASPRRLVIGEVTNRTGERLFDHSAREMLRMGLENSRGLDVLPQTRARETLARMTLDREVPVVGEVGRELCRRQGYELFLEGSIEPTAEGYELRVEGLDCHRGASRFAARRRFTEKDDLTTAAEGVLRELRQALGDLDFASSTPLADATTSSLEALALYSNGLEHQRAGRLVDAREHYETAIEKDPGFALAYAQLAICRNGLGDLAGAFAAAEAAFERRHQATERERHRIALSYHLDRLQYQEALDPARRLAALYSHDAEARRQLAHVYARLGRINDAVTAAREAVELAPGLLPQGVFAGYLGRAGRFDEALQLCREARKIDGDEPSYLDWVEGMIYLGRGEVDPAREHFMRLARVGSVFSEASAHLLALAEVLAGRFEAARHRLDANVASNPESPYWQARDRRLAAGLAQEAGDRQAFRRQLTFFEELSALPIHLRDLRSAALLWAADGSLPQVAAIHRLVSEIDERYPSTISRAVRLQTEAELARLAGEPERAHELLAAARRVWWGDAPLLLSQLRLARDKGDAGEVRRLGRLLVVEKKTEMLELGYGLDWCLLRDLATGS